MWEVIPDVLYSGILANLLNPECETIISFTRMKLKFATLNAKTSKVMKLCFGYCNRL